MKAKVIDIEGVGKAIFGKADDAFIEEILNSIKEDIAEAANESKDKEYHDCVIKILKELKKLIKVLLNLLKNKEKKFLKKKLIVSVHSV